MLRILMLAVCIFLSSQVTAKDCASPLVVSFSGDWAPYFFARGVKDYGGTDYDLLMNITDALDCRAVVLPMTEARSMLELQKGSYDVSIGASYTQQRQQNFHFSLPYREELIGMAVYAGPHKSSATTLKDVLEEGGIIGINMSGYFGDTVEALKTQYRSQFVHGFSLSERIRFLTQNSVDAIVDDRLALCMRLRHSPALIASASPDGVKDPSGLLLTDEILHRDNIHFMFSKKTINAEFVAHFNRELAALLPQYTVDHDCPEINRPILSSSP